MREIAKLKQVLNRIRQLKSQIVFLQEIHLRATEIDRLQKRWSGQILCAPYSNHARGVLILIHKSLPFQTTNVICDQYGRYIIIQGNISTCGLNLVCIYGPNDDNPTFFQSLFLTLSTLQGMCIIGGDFNCTLVPTKDRSTNLDSTHLQTRKILLQSCKELNLVEVWRERHPDKVEYSCYSSTHGTHSRIDYFLVSFGLLSKIKECWYDSIVISDHAAVSLNLHINTFIHNPKRWRFPVELLQDAKFIKFAEERINNYFEISRDQTDACVRWEAFKAYIRGEIISFTKSKAKQQRMERETIENQIRLLEQELYDNYSPQKAKNLQIMRAKYNKLSIEKVAKN